MISDLILEVVAPLADSNHRLPDEVEVRARWLVLDTLGCAIAGGSSETVRAWLNAHRLGTDPFGVPAGSYPREELGSAMALTMGACWDEACEGHAGAHGRPGVAALGALWPSVPEMTWAELIRAVVAGYEVGARMGAVLRISPGMHVDANWPALGAAAAVACALGLDAERIVAAVGIAACQLPTSLYRPVRTGDTARNTYLGHAAVLGRMAAQASAAGVTAPRDAIEEYARVAYGIECAEPVPPGQFEILRGYFKEYAAVRHVHYAARAALELRSQIPAEDVVAVELDTYPEALLYCGNRHPATPLQAQFSLSFGAAAMLRWGRLDPGVYRSPSFDDPLLRSLEERVALRQEPAWADTRAARLRVTGRHGVTVETVVSAVRGDASMPWSQADLVGKFGDYSRTSLSGPRIDALAEHILRSPWHTKVFSH